MNHLAFFAENPGAKSISLVVSDCAADNTVDSIVMEMTELMQPINPVSIPTVHDIELFASGNFLIREPFVDPEVEELKIIQEHVTLSIVDPNSIPSVDTIGVEQSTLGDVTMACVSVEKLFGTMAAVPPGFATDNYKLNDIPQTEYEKENDG